MHNMNTKNGKEFDKFMLYGQKGPTMITIVKFTKSFKSYFYYYF